MSYVTVRRDFERLENIAELDDQVELDSERILLMQNPTKARAAQMYEAGIHLWFREHGVTSETRQIAKRYNVIGKEAS